MDSAVYVDGRIVPPEQATVSVFDRGFLYGDSVYETMRTYGARPFMGQAHIERLRHSAAGIHLQVPWSDPELDEAIGRTVAAVQGDAGRDLYLRVVVTRGAGPIGLDPALADRPSLIVIALPYVPLPPEAATEGVAVRIASIRRTSQDALAPSLKTGNYLNNVMALREARAAGAFEALMLNSRGDLAEATTSNVFLVHGGRVRTPAASSGILPGVTRALVLEVLCGAGIPAEETTLGPEDLASADEAFLTSTLKDVVPVTTVDGRPVGDGRVGPVTSRIAELYRERVGRWIDEGGR